eukprot:CAMPEP_0185012788 /NCGR_PEP_ID=MMETSP1098-20130426/98477_1 /TAXON_ID=89044 /ORGANISM="Spumella elongata, Strain CCAP 955/1" /LENGTH=2117 /DNA_ID=CAMNT_0027541853 /DNA_START=291 /DNA_END=6644 /DNA_ORIENTATION=+
MQNLPMNNQDTTLSGSVGGYNPNLGINSQPRVSQGMDASHSMPLSTTSEPVNLPKPAAMFDAINGSGAPLLSLAGGNPNMPGSVLRAPSIGSFQMGTLQGGHVPMSNVNLAMQGPLLSNGTSTNAKNMQAHNLTSTESFVAMQPQGMVHPTQQLLPPASGAGLSTNNGSSVLSASPHNNGMGQPQQNMPLPSFLSSSHTLTSAPQQVTMPQQQNQLLGPGQGQPQIPQSNLGQGQGQVPGQMMMTTDGMNPHGGNAPQMQNSQQWMQMRPQGNLLPGVAGGPPLQSLPPHGVQNNSINSNNNNPNQAPPMQYHLQSGVPGQGPVQGQGYGQAVSQQAPGQMGQMLPQQSQPGMQMNHSQQQHNPQQMQLPVHQQQQGQNPPQMHMNVIPSGVPSVPQQQQQQQSASSFAGTKYSTKPWHSSEHAGIRNSMVEEIIKLLKTRRPNATEDWHEKLPHMARRLEDALYHEANDLAEYSDNSSLKQRLQQLALSMGGNKQQPPNSKGGPSGAPPAMQQQGNNQMRPQPQYQHQQQQMQNKPFVQGMAPQGQGQQAQYNPQQQQYQQQQMLNRPGSVPGQYPPNSGNPQQPGMPQQNYLAPGTMDYQQQPFNPQNGSVPPQNGMHMQNPQPGQMMHGSLPYNSNNPNPQGMPMNPSGVPQQQQVVNQVPAFMLNPNEAGSNNMQYAPMGMQQNMNRAPQQNANVVGGAPNIGNNPQMQGQSGMMNGQMVPMGNMGNMPHPGQQQLQPGGSGHTDEHRKQVLKQQQQRLLLLRHASKCPHDSGRCPVTPHCWSMKQLWKHIMSCKDQECKVPHCVSSRYVLSHYSKCKEPTCPVCGPVREAIKRNYERSKDIVKSTRASSTGTGAGFAGGQMPAHNAPSRDDPPAKRQKKGKDAGKDKVVDERHMAPTLVIPNRPKPPPRSVYPLDPISCAIYSFSADDIAAHFKSIHEGMKLTVSKIREMCKPIIEELYKVPHAHGIFGSPVDPIMLGIPDYFEVVKMPMDLGTVIKKLSDGSYRDLHHFVVDVHLTFDNSMLYNPKNSDVYMLAKSLKKDFDLKYRQKISDFEKNLAIMRENPEACLICGEISLKFEPPVYYCNGTCAQRIRRNAVFFSNTPNSYHWCNPCFNNLKENETVRLPDCSITKAELARNKKKHTEESEEGWVQCEGGCQRWVHQVCSLFNARRNISDEVSYVCPLCIQAERQRRPDQIIIQPTTKKMSAVDLPVTILSQFLEKRIYKRLGMAYKDNAAKLGVSENDVEKCPPLILRQVSCQDKLHTVREGVYNRYKEKNYPTDFPCRTKCLVLFQNIDGQDVILFGMYVYEYGHKCPQPNQRRVYISYLDSVHYLRPKQYRTLVYHEILISYLDYVRARGFHTAHIWACPPQKGDDYILYVHPPDQKTPKPQILRVWYDEMLKRCVERGIVTEYTDFHTEYLVDQSFDATVMPYFEGDYWVNEAEVIIKNLKTGVRDDDDDCGGAGSKSKRKSKKSSRLVKNEGVKPIQLGKSERDPVMAKLASIIEPMKDTFFVARLHPREYAAKCADKLTAELSAANTTGESSVQQEEKLREEALSGSDVQMPAGAAVSKVSGSSSSQNLAGSAETNEEPQSDADNNQMEDDEEDDFGKAASSIAMDGGANEDGMPSAPSSMRSASMSKSASAMQFSDFSAVGMARASSFGSQAAMEEVLESQTNDADSGNATSSSSAAAEVVEEAGAATPSGRGTRSTRKSRSEAKIKAEDGSEGAENETESTAVTPRENAVVKDEPNSTTAEASSESAEASAVVKEEESYVAKFGSPAASKIGEFKSTGHGHSSLGDKDMDTTAAATEETKVKTEGDTSSNEAMDVVKTEGTTEGAVEAAASEGAAASDSAAPVLVPSPLIMVGEDMPDLKDDTEDVDDIQENEHFETRQSFLNLCQGNHYQFDQLRRAKHTSMMVLYHLHNPDAPKFVPSCNLCHIDILTGYRHHCDNCEIDFCQNCVSNSMMKVHQHPLRPMAIANSAPQQLTEEQRRERARSVQLHMQLLLHAANCVKCESKNCHRMKEFLKHDGICTVKSHGGCRLCARITNLLNIHARACRVENCKVPHCLELREQMRKLAMRQQQMDDRRRQNMNHEYGRGGPAPAGDVGGDDA